MQAEAEVLLLKQSLQDAVAAKEQLVTDNLNLYAKIR